MKTLNYSFAWIFKILVEGEKHKIRTETNLDKIFVMYTQKANFLNIQQTLINQQQ